MKWLKTKKQKISEECWNLDGALIGWLNEHLKVYREEASRVVDLEYYKHRYKRKEYTTLQIIDRLIEITNYLLSEDLFNCDYEKLEKLKDEMYDLLKLVHWNLWW